MHNRVRMITASFLVKDLLIDWRHGEQHFRRLLADGDVPQNVGNWQWVAGTGPDAAPYFRVFNPTLQSRKFDPAGDYLRRWVPELAGLDDTAIHEPSALGPLELAAAGVTLGDDYPVPDRRPPRRPRARDRRVPGRPRSLLNALARATPCPGWLHARRAPGEGATSGGVEGVDQAPEPRPVVPVEAQHHPVEVELVAVALLARRGTRRGDRRPT